MEKINEGELFSISSNSSKGGKFGRELKVSPKSHVYINEAGFKVEYFVPTIEIQVGIGNDHTALLVMTKDSWEAFKSGEEISIETNKEFLESFKK